MKDKTLTIILGILVFLLVSAIAYLLIISVLNKKPVFGPETEFSINVNNTAYQKPPYPHFGLTTLMPKDNIAFIKNLGINFIRSPTNYSIAAKYGFEFVNNIGGDANSLGDGNLYPTDPTLFIIKRTDKVNQYKDYTHYYQVGNEPDNTWDWESSPQSYINLISLSKQVTGSNDPNAIILNGGLGTMWDTNGADEFFQSGGNNLINTFDIHYYGTLGNNDTLILETCKEGYGHCSSYTKITMQDKQKEILDYMKNNGGIKPIWVTEFGIYLNNLTYTNVNYEKRKAEDMIKKHIILLANKVSRVFIIGISDWENSHCNSDNWDRFFCISLTNEKHKIGMIYSSYKTMVGLLNEANFISENTLIAESKTLKLYEFKNIDKTIFVVWAQNNKDIWENISINITLNFDISDSEINYNNVAVIDGINGHNLANRYKIDNTDKIISVYNVTVTQTPRYIILEKFREYCGDKICNAGESCSSCYKDCGYCNNLVNGLKLYLPFDEGKINHKDYSLNYGNTFYGNYGNGTIIITNGKVGQTALHLNDGSSIASGRYGVDSAEFSNELTLSAWLKLDLNSNLDKRQVFTDSGWNYMLYYEKPYWKFSMNIRNESSSGRFKTVSSSITPERGVWYYVAGVFNGTHMKIYINGEKNAESYIGGGTNDNHIYLTHVDGLYIGGGGVSSKTNPLQNYYAYGDIDELRLYDRVLSDIEINNLYELNAISCLDGDNDGYSVVGGECGEIDCDDNNQNVNPVISEVCNGIDDNCNSIIDEGCGSTPPGGPGGSGGPSGCTPNCIGKQCGSNGCGGFCGNLRGNCSIGYKCVTNGTCIINSTKIIIKQTGNQSLIFVYENISYNIAIINITNTSVLFLITPGEINIEINIGKEKEIDLNNDDKIDIILVADKNDDNNITFEVRMQNESKLNIVLFIISLLMVLSILTAIIFLIRYIKTKGVKEKINNILFKLKGNKYAY